MLFEDNPFYRLHAHSTDGQAQIADLAEEACLEADSDEQEAQYREAESILVNPRKRVMAEVTWLCGISKSQAYHLLEVLPEYSKARTWDAKEEEAWHKEWNSLSPWNRYLCRLNTYVAKPGQPLAGSILKEMDDCYEQTSVSSLRDCINRERRKARLPDIQDDLWVREGMDQVLAETFSCLRKRWIAGNPLWVVDMVNWEIKITEKETEFLARIMALYEDCLGSKIDEKEKLCYNALTQIKNNQVQAGLNLFTKHFHDWVHLGEPLNAYNIKFNSTCIPRVWYLLGEVREAALHCHNDLQDTRSALALTNLVLNDFSTAPELGKRFREDQAVLLRMMAQVSAVEEEREKTSGGVQRQSGTAAKKPWWKVSPKWRAIIFIGLYVGFIGYATFDDSPKKSNPPVIVKETTTVEKPAPVVTPPQEPEKPKYEKPDIKGKLFNRAEIRWTLREQIRLETLENMNLTNAGIAAYNQMVEEYNYCASEYRYYPRDYSAAEQDVEQERDSIAYDMEITAMQNGWVY